MNYDDMIADLKQFIAATVAQAVADLPTRDEMDQRFAQMDQRFAQMDQRFAQMDQRFDDLETKLDTVADAHAEMLGDHEHRLKRLEKRPATA